MNQGIEMQGVAILADASVVALTVAECTQQPDTSKQQPMRSASTIKTLRAFNAETLFANIIADRAEDSNSPWTRLHVMPRASRISRALFEVLPACVQP